MANFYNDSVSVLGLKARRKMSEIDLRPGATDPAKTGVAGGEYCYWIAIRQDDKAYISSPRDREIVVLQLAGNVSVAARIPVRGLPNRLLLNRAQNRLFTALDNSDTVAVIDRDRVIATFDVTAPAGLLPSRQRSQRRQPEFPGALT